MITIEVGPGDTPQTIAQRYPDVEPVYLAPLKDPLAERQTIPIYRLPVHEYHEPIKVKPRSKRGQRKRMWR